MSSSHFISSYGVTAGRVKSAVLKASAGLLVFALMLGFMVLPETLIAADMQGSYNTGARSVSADNPDSATMTADNSTQARHDQPLWQFYLPFPLFPQTPTRPLAPEMAFLGRMIGILRDFTRRHKVYFLDKK